MQYTVILLYPVDNWPDESPETYTEHSEAEGAEEAIQNVREMAEHENRGAIRADEFNVIAVYEGHLDAELTANDF